jgi:ketosteroid isomerase-like protein
MDPNPDFHKLTLSVFDAMNSRDFTGLESNVTDAVSFDFPGAGRVESARRVILFLKALLRKYPRLEFTVNEIIVEGNKACAVWTNEGENSTGERYENSGMTLIHFENDKIAFISDYFKDTSFV